MKSFIDTHCHIYLNSKTTEKEIIDNFKKSGWEYIICIWIDLDTSKKAINLAKKYDFIFATIWIHPSDSIKYIWNLEKTIDELKDLYNKNKEYIVWIWECWLDYYHTDKEDIEAVENQKEFFISQINLAKSLDLPVIIHNRESKDDMIKIIKKEKLQNFIFHCYSEDLEYANKLIKHSSNCMISFSWIVTFNNARAIQETASKIPLENILIETDAPFLTPVPFRGKMENQPSFTKYVLDKIVVLRWESEEEIQKKIIYNSKKIFNLK